MIRSMTGYGRAKDGNMTVEIRSVNHRYLDVNIRTPRAFSFLEEPISALISKNVARGKTDVNLLVDNLSAETTRLLLNRDILDSYLETGRILHDEYDLVDDLTVFRVMRLPDVMVTVQREPDKDDMTARVSEITKQALSEFSAMRIREGKRLAEDISQKLCRIEELVGQIETRMPQTVTAYREKITAKMTEILSGTQVDSARILQEAALYADRVAVDEETVRLRSHIEGLREMLRADGAIGRKIDFLVQEFGREINTIGSKCSDIQTSRLVIDLKGEIEKIREQAQNIE